MLYEREWGKGHVSANTFYWNFTALVIDCQFFVSFDFTRARYTRCCIGHQTQASCGDSLAATLTPTIRLFGKFCECLVDLLKFLSFQFHNSRLVAVFTLKIFPRLRTGGVADTVKEVGHLIVALRKSFFQSGQLFVTSHTPEAFRKFSDENTVDLARKSHLEPTTAQWLSDMNYQGDLTDSLIQGDFSIAIKKYAPRVFVIPEDAADRQFAVEFERDYRLKPRALQVMPAVGGCKKLVEKIMEDYVPRLWVNHYAHVVGISDCDEESTRIADELDQFPEDLRYRVFLLWVYDEPQDFRRAMSQTFEEIGATLADECYNEEFALWKHPHLAHNQREVARASAVLRSVLFE